MKGDVITPVKELTTYNVINLVKELMPNEFSIKTGEMTETQLVDAMYRLRALSKLFVAREKLINEVLKVSMEKVLNELTEENPTLEVHGITCPGFLAVRVYQKRLDTKAIEEEMGEDWVEEHLKEIDFFQFKAIKEVV